MQNSAIKYDSPVGHYRWLRIEPEVFACIDVHPVHGATSLAFIWSHVSCHLKNIHSPWSCFLTDSSGKYLALWLKATLCSHAGCCLVRGRRHTEGLDFGTCCPLQLDKGVDGVAVRIKTVRLMIRCWLKCWLVQLKRKCWFHTDILLSGPP